MANIEGIEYGIKRLTVRERLDVQRDQLRRMGVTTAKELEGKTVSPELEAELNLRYVARCVISGPSPLPRPGAEPLPWSMCSEDQRLEVLYAMEAPIADALYIAVAKANSIPTDEKKNLSKA